jgi:hypothetical protein
MEEIREGSLKKKLRQTPGVGSSEWTKDTIRLLLGARKPEFSFEREIRLYEFQAWIYLPCAASLDRSGITAKSARIIAASKFLEHIASKNRTALLTEQRESARLIALLKIKEYRDLFDAAFVASGGWLNLMNTITPAAYDQTIIENLKDVKIAADLIDFRFRYLDHGETNE